MINLNLLIFIEINTVIAVNSSICGEGAELYLLVFPLVNGKRVPLNLVVSFDDTTVAERWRNLIKKSIEAPLARKYLRKCLRAEMNAIKPKRFLLHTKHK